MDAFVKDVMAVEEIPNIRMIDYKGKFCMVRKLKNDSSILKMNPTLKYLVRYTEGKTPTDNNLYSISYIPISEKEFNTGLESYKSVSQKMKGGRKTKKSVSQKILFRKK